MTTSPAAARGLRRRNVLHPNERLPAKVVELDWRLFFSNTGGGRETMEKEIRANYLGKMMVLLPAETK